MRAAVLHAVGEPLKIEQVPTPEPGPGEVLVKIAGAGVCHSDLHLIDGSIPLSRFPLILGHENAGWVEKLGPGAEGIFAPGDPVVVYGGWGCGHCQICLGGEEQLCGTDQWGGLGPDGGYAEYMIVPSTRHLIPADGLDLVETAALTDAGLTPYRAVKKTLPYLLPGSSVLVIGAGGLGQYGVQYLRLLTQAKIIIVETSAAKRALALELGADVAIDASSPDALAQVKKEAGGEGVNAAIDFVGVDSTISLGQHALARKGILVLVGLAGGGTRFSFFDQGAEARLTNSNWGSHNDLVEVLALARAGKLRATTERYRLDEVNDVLHRLEQGKISGRAVLVP